MKPKLTAIHLAHSPDADDAFMFYAILKNKIDTPPVRIINVVKDIETLNNAATQGKYEITALSFHAYARLQDKYKLMRCGASFGLGYGPIVVAKKHIGIKELKEKTILVPGKLTTAYLLLLDAIGINFKAVEMEFSQIPSKIVSGKADAGLLIHDAQLTFSNMGLVKIFDLSEYWRRKNPNLPLPLGGLAIKRDTPNDLAIQLENSIRNSISYGLKHTTEALEYAQSFAKCTTPELTLKFVKMYVNNLTLDFGEKGKEAIDRILAMANKYKPKARRGIRTFS
jgi:1,4-dihydroxy-6-naphthoate synthase